MRQTYCVYNALMVLACEKKIIQYNLIFSSALVLCNFRCLNCKKYINYPQKVLFLFNAKYCNGRKLKKFGYHGLLVSLLRSFK